MKKHFLSIAIASSMVLEMGLSVFAKKPKNNDEAVIQAELDTVVNNVEDISTDIQAESELEGNDNMENDETTAFDTDMTEEPNAAGNTDATIDNRGKDEDITNDETINDVSVDGTEKTEERIDGNAEQEKR